MDTAPEPGPTSLGPARQASTEPFKLLAASALTETCARARGGGQRSPGRLGTRPGRVERTGPPGGVHWGYPPCYLRLLPVPGPVRWHRASGCATVAVGAATCAYCAGTVVVGTQPGKSGPAAVTVPSQVVHWQFAARHASRVPAPSRPFWRLAAANLSVNVNVTGLCKSGAF